MLYMDQVVDVPEHNVTRVLRDHFIYVKEYADSCRNSDGTRNTNRKQPIIGRLVQATQGCMQMYPNETYYKLRDLPLPPRNYSKLGTPGRKSDAVYAQGASVFPGFAMLCAIALIDCHAYELILKHFGKELGEQIMFMAAHYASGRSSLECLDLHSIMHNVFAGAGGMNKQAGSALLADGIRSEDMSDFFADWITIAAGNDPIAYDVTALPTKAKGMVLAERGYAHGGPELPQINYALMANSRTGMPIFFSHYNGSITDKANLQYVLDMAPARNLPGKLTMIFGRGFASLKNIAGLIERGVPFIMGVPSTFTGVMERLDAFNRRTEYSVEESFIDLGEDGTWASEVTVGKTEDCEWQGLKLKLHLYRNQARNSEKGSRLLAGIRAIQEHLKISRDFPEGSFLADAKACFKKEGKGRGAKWVADSDIYNKKLRNYGSFALFSSPECNYSTGEALRLFRSREIDEEIFNCLKTDLKGLPLRVWSDKSLDGKFFVLFIAAIIRKHILFKVKDILIAERKSFNYLKELLEAHKYEVRGDGSIAPASVKSTLESSVFARMCRPEFAKEMGLKDHYVIKPKKKSGKKTR